MRRFFKLPGVRLFASGFYRGREYPPAVVAAVGSGMRRLGPRGSDLHLPPAVLGHEEAADQEWLNRTDLPAAGWVDPTTAKCIPDPEHPGHLILVADIVNVPAEAADLITSGKFRYGSAEIYEDFTDDMGRGFGPALRRFALLGAMPPQCKRLRQLPRPVPMAAAVEFAERLTCAAGRCRGRTAFVRFDERVLPTTPSEVPMSPDSMAAAIMAAVEAGDEAVLQALFDALPDEMKAAATGGGDPAAAAQDAAMMSERRKLQGFVGKFSEDFRKMGRNGGDILSTFDQVNKTRREKGQKPLTATEFTGSKL